MLEKKGSSSNGTPMVGAIDMSAVGPEVHFLRGGEHSEYSPLPIDTLEPFVLRHTPMNSQGSTPFQFGRTSSYHIPITGDYLGPIVLQINLPALPSGAGNYKEKIGMLVWQRVRLVYDGTVLQDIERLYVDLKNRLFQPPEYKAGWKEMIGDVEGGLSAETSQTLYIPLPFACGRHLHHRTMALGLGSQQQHTDRLWLPLMGLKDHMMQIEIVWSSGLDDLLQDASSVSESDGVAYQAQTRVLMTATVAEVGRGAKLRALRQPSFLLIDKVQDVEGTTYDDSIRGDGTMSRIPKKEVRMSLAEVNSPVKSFVFAAYDDDESPFTYRSGSFFGPSSLSLGGFRYRFQDEDPIAFKMGLVSGIENSHPDPSIANVAIVPYFFSVVGDYYNPTSSLDFATLGTSPELVVKLNEASTSTTVKMFVTSTQIIKFSLGKYQLLFKS